MVSSLRGAGLPGQTHSLETSPRPLRKPGCFDCGPSQSDLLHFHIQRCGGPDLDTLRHRTTRNPVIKRSC